MRIFRSASSPVAIADATTFVGAALTQRVASDTEGGAVAVYRVEFQPGARTNWHTHSGSQWLLIVDGRVRVQTWDGAAQDLAAGDAVVIHAGEKHWHSAAPGGGAHLAVNVNAATEWLEPVSDEQYRVR